MFKFIAIFIILTNIALPKISSAQIKAPPEKLKIDNFLMLHGDLELTLKLEKDFHRALKERDLIWMKNRAEGFKTDAEHFLDALEKQGKVSPDEALVMGSCHYASFALHEAIFSASLKTKLARKKSSNFEKIASDIHQKLTVNIRRCELIKGRTLSERLLISE